MPHSAGEMIIAALAWHDAGCSVVRTATDGTKAPLGAWKQYQQQRATRDAVAAWYADEHPGVGIITGAVSGDLEMFELEGRAVRDGFPERLIAQLAADGHPELFARLAAAYCEVTPSGGIHLLYRVEDGEVDGNTKLARRSGPADPNTGKPTVEVLAETRGEGGFVVTAPSHGPVHPGGSAWRTVAGSPASIPAITGAQRDALHLAARALDELPLPAPIPDPPVLDPDRKPGGVAPGEDFNARATWSEVLEPHGWTVARALADRTYWTRPGKRYGVSAVTGGGDGDYFYSWTTSTELPSEVALSKWRVFALQEHAGDFSVAARALRHRGYGQPAPEPTRPVFTVVQGMSTTGALATAPDLESPAPLLTLAHSDDGNALALVDSFGDRIRYCPDRGRWLSWTGYRWEWCPPGGGAIREYAKIIARSLPDGDKAERTHKQRSLGAIGTTAMLTQAGTDPRIVVALGDLDARPYELNTPGGIVDLRTGQLCPADPAHLHTRITVCSPNGGADGSRWLAFLADTFAGHADLPGYVQRLVGYSATGVVRDHVLPFAFGPGANGKGVFLETIRAVLGDYATTAPSGFLMAKTYNPHETEIARLSGARMVVASEVNESDKFDEARVKQLTGGDTLTAHFMRQDHFTFVPTHKLWLMGNYQPNVNSGGHAFWRRLRIVPFDNIVPEDKRVEDLQGILARDHGPAVLAWIVAGAAAYFAGGLATPRVVLAATDEYEHNQDTVSRFVEECCHIGGAPHVQIQMSSMREAYERWCHAEGVTAVSAIALGKALRARFGVTDSKGTSGRRLYVGIGLVADEETATGFGRKDLA